MKNRSNIAAFFLGVIATLITCVALGIQPPRHAEAQAPSIQKWEYALAGQQKPLADQPSALHALDIQGELGWELVALDSKDTMVFKRRKQLSQ